MLWTVFAMMTSAVVLALARSLSKRGAGFDAHDSDVAFYRGLLAEADDDVRCGLVAPEDAVATRAEIGRRLLASLDSASESRPRVLRRWQPRRAAAALAIVLALPLVALASYLKVGAPSQPDMPTASRRTGGNFTLATAISEVETRLTADPNEAADSGLSRQFTCAWEGFRMRRARIRRRCGCSARMRWSARLLGRP